MATIDGSNLRWLSDDRIIGWKALWTIRLVLGAYFAWLCFRVGSIVAAGSVDGLAYIFGQMLGLAGLYWVALRIVSGIQTPRPSSETALTEADIDVESTTLTKVLAGHEPGEVLTDREIKREGGGNDEWWNETAKSQLKTSDYIEQADSTGRRWRVIGENDQESS